MLGAGRLAEGTAVGYNPAKKGQRSYWPLFATVAQTGQALDVPHRPGNVADSTGALDFIGETTEWRRAGKDVSFFELRWKPAGWHRRRRLVVVRRRVPLRRKEPLRLDLFEPREHGFEFKAVATNKRVRARTVALFHEGRGAQEAMFAELKSQCGLGCAPCRKEAANRVFALAAVLAHNLGRELQMASSPPARRTNAKRSPLWAFAQLRTMRNDFLLRAGRFVNSGQKRVLSIMNDPRAETAMSRYLDALAT